MSLKQQRQHENTNIIEEQYANNFQPCQESLELKAGASGVIGFDDPFCLSVCLLVLPLRPTPHCFLHLHLCEHWHLKDLKFSASCINSLAHVELQPLLIPSLSVVLQLNYSTVCNPSLHSLAFSMMQSLKLLGRRRPYFVDQ